MEEEIFGAKNNGKTYLLSQKKTAISDYGNEGAICQVVSVFSIKILLQFYGNPP